MPVIAASDNRFRIIRLVEAAAPSTPPTGDGWLYAKTDGTLAYKNDAGAEVVLGTAGGTALDDLTDVDAPTPADGDVLTWVDANSAWESVAPGGVTIDAYGPTAEYRPDRPPASPSADDDEFDDGTVSGWSAWSGATDPGTDDETTYPGKRLIVASTSVSAPSNSTKSYAPSSGTAFTIACKLAWNVANLAANHSFHFGLAVLQSDGTLIHEVATLDDGTNTALGHRAYDSISTTTRGAGTGGWHGAPVYLAIGRDTGNLYSAWISHNGYTWLRLAVSTALATAVGLIGYRIRTNGATGGDRSVITEWFRRFTFAPSANMKVGS